MAQVDYAAIDAPPPTSVNPDQNDDDYHRLSEGSNEIKQGSCMKWMKSERFIQNSICIGLITALLYVLLCVVSFMMMSESKGIESASIYTQALDDWTAKAWTDFIWSNTGDCPDGYEPLTRTWGGTFRFNATNGYVIEYVDSLDMKSKYPADFQPIPPREQSLGLFTGMPDIMCGQRGALSFTSSTLAKEVKSMYTCPAGLTACSTNIAAEGSTYCVDAEKGELCPITELRVFDKTQFDSSDIKIDTRYVIRESSLPTDQTAKQLVIAFTRIAGQSNSPLQKLVWSSGVPCAYTEFAEHFNANNQPWYHVAEKDGYQDACTKRDERYQTSSEINPPPNEMQIQQLSGVWDIISNLPQQDGFDEKALPQKEATSYYLQTRPTIKFSASCGKNIKDAITTQENLSASAQTENGWLGLAILSIFMVLLHFIFNMIICCKKNDNDGCNQELGADSLMMALIKTLGIFFTSAMVFMVTCTNFAQISAKYHDYEAWQQYSSCLDDYTAIPGEQVDSMRSMYTFSIIALILGTIIVIPHTFLMICHWILYCKK